MSETPRPIRRVFFALWPADDVRERIERAVRDRVQGRGRAIPPQNLHVTLLFLGEIETARVADAMAAADEVAGAPFEVCFDQIETWPRSSVLCLTSAAPPAAAAELSQALRRRLSQRGFTLQDEVFRAHVTLARDAPRVRSTTPVAPLRWPVSDFTLVESNMTKTGSEYSVLARWPLVA